MLRLLKRPSLWSVLLLGLLAAGCDRKPVLPPVSESALPALANEEPSPKASAGSVPKPAPASTPFAEIWKQFSGDRALAHVQKLVEFGPRPSGSAALEDSRKYLEERLRASGWQVTRDAFKDKTPRGEMEFVNLIARFGGSAGTQQAIVGSHFDTKLFSTIKFLGANDGGSSTGALLELARVLALEPALARRVELVFFDGEEAFSQFSDTDGLYGSRHYAGTLRDTKRAKQFKLGVVLDMIGDKNLTVTLPPDTPAELARQFFAAADALGSRSHFTYFDRPILDDHAPLNAVGIPSIDLIDFRFDYWHTADDTLDKLSAESLRLIGTLTLFQLRQALPK